MYPKYQIPCTFFGTKMKKEKKYMKMCKNKKYSKGVPFGVFRKNIKYVPKILGTFKYVPNVPNIRYILGTT